MSNNLPPSEYDYNYKWRAIGGMITIASVNISATIIGTVSKSQSASSILKIYGIAATITLIVIFLVFRIQSSEDQRGWSMDNPTVAVIIALLVQIIVYFTGQAQG